jgi:membrane protease YdiL (CAAX protease family)
LENQKTNSVPPLDIVLVLVATFFVFLFVSAASLYTLGNEATLIVGELLILAVPLAYLLFKRIDIKSYVRIDLNPKFILIGLACGGLLLLLNIAVSNALTAIFGVSQAVEQSNTLITGLAASPSGLAAVATSLALAGICEEFAFRGFLQNSIFKEFIKNAKSPKYALAVAVIISAAVFGLFHFDPQFVYTLSAFISGLALGYIYHRWNYTTSVTAHASMNLIVLALLLLGI